MYRNPLVEQCVLLFTTVSYTRVRKRSRFTTYSFACTHTYTRAHHGLGLIATAGTRRVPRTLRRPRRSPRQQKPTTTTAASSPLSARQTPYNGLVRPWPLAGELSSLRPRPWSRPYPIRPAPKRPPLLAPAAGLPRGYVHVQQPVGLAV